MQSAPQPELYPLQIAQPFAAQTLLNEFQESFGFA
jgi:hypothetical protein